MTSWGARRPEVKVSTPAEPDPAEDPLCTCRESWGGGGALVEGRPAQGETFSRSVRPAGASGYCRLHRLSVPEGR